MTRPNVLIVMVDQLAGTLFPDGPASWLVTPNLARIAEQSVRFANCYTASPLCAPGRGGFMTSRLPSATGIYDNAAEFRAELPTFAHLLRRAGWRTCLSGKMHFVGPDQLHGFEERLTTDIYPADFGWTPDWRRPGERIDWWYHNLGSVTQAGVAEITNQLEYDDEVGFLARQWLYDAARGADARPWCLTVSFTHPHDPYVARRRDWDLYAGCEHLLPEVPALPYESHDPHSQRIFDANDWRSYHISDNDITRARRAYFANISYIDRQIGEILQVMEDTRQEAVVIFCSDHGDMLGERGLWFKMSFFEGSARVPLMIAAPELAPARIDAPVSLMDLGPTLLELLGIEAGDAAEWWDGRSLLPLVAGGERGAPVAMEYAAEASVAPMVALVEGGWKYTRCRVDPEQLFDLKADPHELTNLAADPAHADRLAAFRAKADAMWDLDRFEAEVRDSQARRLIVYEALRKGGYYPWDYQPLKDASERFMRNHKDLNVLEESQRFPRGE
ncbi:choline-sulfatase [Meinhardsimonia xiamenensis]|jgi:choline-sulfatase|uniref:Choline-sulfatase n=1 Tax=Meinhardsimonia xiamenensis TaxID=990712 RepID=A0A1G9ATA8_9RHOB|nr:choline-sulfatase [Meinhardsimonia xiamenensis]PRX35257.1 choline-sulfatase [Meinhardsimonia xiamenensis]SDK30453.1 choline-sulfatase [Meinhardsimonia xiamenensis]